ncbi:MAG: alpha/beta hydrolase, partial [Gammaproteobacteria bacterium]
LFYSSNVFSGTFISLITRFDVHQPFWLIDKENAAASVILFTGGKGRIDINESGIGRGGNFLVRNREKFARYSLNVAVIDAPTDQEKLFYFRTTEEHAADIKAVIKYMRDKYKKPVWLVGTSRGTTSVASVASWLQGTDGPDGIVLTATISRNGKKGESVNDVALKDINVPVLFVHNSDDECKVCPPGAIGSIAEQMTNAKIKEIKFFSGGYTEGRKCGPQSYHGFLGIEDEVVQYIARWVKAH